jgi:hypothetical protein
LTPGSRIRNRFVPDPGPQVPTIFWVKSTNSLGELARIFFYLFKNKIIFNFVIFVATKKVGKKHFSPPFGAVVGSGIRDPGWIKIRIWHKHSRSATLIKRMGQKDPVSLA